LQLSIIMAQPTHHFFDAPDARVSYFEWGPKDGPALLMIHATGFHARVFDQTIKQLPDGLRIIAVDQRGHGQSTAPGPIQSWREPPKDIAPLIAHLDLQTIVGVGHSMGGHTLTQLCHAMPERFKALVLLDPVIKTPEQYEIAMPPPFDRIETHPIGKRRSDWPSIEAFYDRLKDHEPYSLWDKHALMDYCRHGLLPKGDGFELACPGLIEASVYMTSSTVPLFDIIPQITQPVTVVRARQGGVMEGGKMDFSISPTWPELAGHFPQGRDIFRPDLTHFIPMQAPQDTASIIIEALSHG